MENRRSFMTWFASFFGLGAVSTVEPVVLSKSKGFIALTLNVGQLPPFKAEAFIERVKEQWRKNDLRKALDDWEIVVIPVRGDQQTKIEVFSFDGQHPRVPVQQLLRDETPFEYPDKNQTIDFILMMLGAPISRVELDERQISAAYDETKASFEQVAKAKGLVLLNRGGMGQTVFKNIMLAKATIMLGHIRRKYSYINDLKKLKLQIMAQNPEITIHNLDEFVKNDPMEMDGDDLVKEGNDNLIYWTQYLDAI